jgi:hypothetical protein
MLGEKSGLLMAQSQVVRRTLIFMEFITRRQTRARLKAPQTSHPPNDFWSGPLLSLKMLTQWCKPSYILLRLRN